VSTMNVLAFGEILWDIIDGVEHLGGAPFNFAAHICKGGSSAAIVSRLGHDARGDKAYNLARSYGVDTTLIERDASQPTGTVDVMLNNGQPDYTIHQPVAYDFISAEAALAAVAKNSFDVFYFGSLAQRHHVSQAALIKLLDKGKFSHVFYDVNLRKEGYSNDIVLNSLRHCSIFKLNIDEVPVIASMTGIRESDMHSFCKQLMHQFSNLKIVIVTAAEKGAYIYADDQLSHIPAVPVKVVDAVGAGDSFSAAFMTIYFKTGDALQAGKVANRVGAFVASNAGPIPHYSKEIGALFRNA
jgi:fructokinase